MGIKDQILAAEDIAKSEPFTIPEWGVEVIVRGLDDAEMGEHQAKAIALRAKQGKGEAMEVELRNRRAELVVKALLDAETGERIFDDKDAPKLARKNSGIVSGLYRLAEKMSGQDRSFEQQVRDAEGNSETGQS